MEKKLFSYIWHNSWRDQLWILAMVVASQVLYFASLDLTKKIVNDAIQGEAFQKTDTARFLEINLPVPDFLAGFAGKSTVPLFQGFSLHRLGYLVALCVAFLFFVVVNGWLKRKVNTDKGKLGERMLRRLRYELFDRVMRFPLGYLRKVKQAEIATMIKDEVDPLGGFIGDAFIQPAFLGGTAITALYFIFLQSTLLGAVSLGVLALQGIIIPKLRVKVLMLGKERQLTARQLAGRIAECVDGALEIRTNDTSNYERADIVARLGNIFHIRFELYQRKFFVKYLNNTLAQTTPFLFYLIGGYLTLNGKFDVGGLVAAIGAYKDLPSPIKELIDWDQARQDVQIKYDQVIEQFSPPDMLDGALHHPALDRDLGVGALVAERIDYHDEGGARLLDNVSLEVGVNARLAILGDSNSGKEYLGLMLARLLPPSSGTLRYAGHDMATVSEAAIGKHFGYIGEETYLFPRSIYENAVYGLKHRQIAARELSDAEQAAFEERMAEAERAGNPPLDIAAEWIDYPALGLSGQVELERHLFAFLDAVGLSDDIYLLGLRGRIDPKAQPDLAEQFLLCRRALHARLRDSDLADLVEPFDPERYNKNMTLGENLLFGTPVGPDFAPENLEDNMVLMHFLQKEGIADDLTSIGLKITETMVEIFADLPPGNPLFEQFSFIAADDLQDYQQLTGRVKKSGLAKAAAADKRRLMALAFPYSETRHRLDLIDGAMETRLLQCRKAFRASLSPQQQQAIDFYDLAHYNASATVQDNLLFGRTAYGKANATQKVGALVAEIVAALDIKGRVTKVGLDYNVGGGGKKLSPQQRQKLSIVRALLKSPRLLILNGALTVFDEAAQQRLLNAICGAISGQALVVITDNVALARMMDQALIVRDGRIVESGTVANLDKPGTAFSALASDMRGKKERMHEPIKVVGHQAAAIGTDTATAGPMETSSL